MNKRVVVIVAVVLVAVVGLVIWNLRKAPAKLPPPAPRASSPAIEPTAPPAIPLAQYDAELKRMAEQYQTAVAALGSTATQRLTKKDEWQSTLQKTLGDLSRLTAPSGSRQAHQDRYILLLQLKQELATASPSIDRVQKLEASMGQLWK